MNEWTAILISVPLTFAAAWFGGRFHGLIASSHVRIQTLLSFVGGLMLGMALLHLVPHAVVQLGSLDQAMYGMLAGLIGVFLLIRFLGVHSHDAGPDASADASHDHTEHDGPDLGSGSRVRWVVLLSGLGLHSVVDGLAVASAVMVACSEHARWPGLSILVVVLLHKPIDAVSLTGTMAAVGESDRRRTLINYLFAAITPLATIGAFVGFVSSGSGAGMAMAVAAGAFICVALADLMPEVQFHSHHRARFTLALAMGIALSWAIGLFEPEGHHHLPTDQPTDQPDAAAHNHHGHGHAGHSH
ncbi:MAG: ZIP family metal transporter [Planctomycetota bacterium]